MPHPPDEPGLYGISSANSSRHGADLWGKNQFNSTFPLSLCLHMRDNDVKPVTVLSRHGTLVADDTQWHMRVVIGPPDYYYHFEKEFDGFKRFFRGSEEADKIDLVASRDGVDKQALEIKLTVVPDSGTATESDEGLWGPEMVMRPVSSAHAMMSLARSLNKKKHKSTMGLVVSALRKGYNTIADWDNVSEVSSNADVLRDSLAEALKAAESVQRPFLIQPIWKTEGQSLVLCDRCFDVFAWSNVAVMTVPLANLPKPNKKRKVSRPLREVARHVRALYEVLSLRDYSYRAIYKGMGLGHQTDKSFAIPGRITREYLKHPRLKSPHYSRDKLGELILNAGERELRPERRFDAAALVQMTKSRTRHG